LLGSEDSVDVVLMKTEGRALEAEIEVDGQRLTVMDGISAVEREAAPGPVPEAKFDVIVVEPRSWGKTFSENPGREKKLEHRWGWRYLGYGEIIAIDPVRVDLGVLVLELDFRTDDPGRLGEWVAIAIDRIRLSRAGD
jgi:hypothetical protein